MTEDTNILARRLTAVAAMAATMAAVPAAVHAADEEALDEVVITATGTAIRGVAPTGSAVLNISRDELLEAPVREASEIIRALPQGSGLGFSEVVGAGGGNNSRSSGVNLRGLGGNATLVLFDGHRIGGQGIINQFADPNQIPFAAIERVEIVTDGASAIYGSDAVAGVVNYIIRRDYTGFEAAVRHNTNDLFNTTAIDAVGGFSIGDGRGNVTIGFTAEDRGGFRRGERPYLRQDLRAFGGNDNRRVGTTITPGSPGNIVVTTTTGAQVVYGIPGNNTGIPTAAQLLPLANQPNLADTADFTNYLPERERRSTLLRFRYDLTDRAKLNYTLLASRRDTEFQQYTLTTISVPTTSSLFIGGLPNQSTTAPIIVQYNPTLNGGPNIQKPYESAVNHFLDFSLDLAKDWQMTASVVRGVTTGCGVCGSELNNTFPNAYANTPADVGLLNPYISGVQPGITRIFGTTYQKTWINLDNAVLRFEGPLANLPAGALRASIGGEYAVHDHTLWLNQNIRNYTNTFQTVRDTFVERKINSAFVETFVPLFGEGNARPGLQKLDLSLAVRYDDYSDFGGTTNPKIGITWKPTAGLDVRGTWGKAFRAPTLTETNPQTISLVTRQNVTNASGDATLPITDPLTGSTYMFQRIGNTAGLKPETAEVWSLGFDWQVAALEGLRLSATYYSVDYQDRIEAVPNALSALATPANRALYAPFIVVAPQPTTCVPGNFATYNPLLVQLFATPFQNNLGSSANDCTARGYIEAGQQNLGELQQRGLDLSASYQFDTAAGQWQVGSTLSKILKLDKAFLRGGALTDVLDTIGFQVGTRANASLGWSRNRWSANLKVNYIGSYLNNTPITVAGVRQPNSNVPAWTTLDGGVVFSIPTEDSSMLSGLRLSLSATNLTDKDPPIVLTGANAIDPLVHDPFGRTLAFELSKKF